MLHSKHCHHKHRHPHGDFPFGGGGFPFGPPGGPGFGRRGPKARRGDVRTAALLLLAEEPRNGYQIMQELEERTDGAWRPSAGSVYPALQLLEDEGLIRSSAIDGRKLYDVTDAGREHVAHREGQPAPWDQMKGEVPDEARATMGLVREIVTALSQVMTSGSADQRTQARTLLTGVRRDLYRILADGGDEAA